MGISTAVLSAEVIDSPTSLIAVTRVMTSVWSDKLKGDALRSATRIVHSEAAVIVLSFSASQLFESIAKVEVDVFTSSL